MVSADKNFDEVEISTVPTATDLAAKLLKDAAAFFETLSEQNPDIAGQMRENASVFRQVSDLVLRDPTQEFGDESDLHGSEEAAETFVERPAWISDIWEKDAGDRMPFTDAIPWERCGPQEVAWWTEQLIQQGDDGRLVLLPDEPLLGAATFWVSRPAFYGNTARLLHIAGPESDPRDGFFLEFDARSDGGDRRILPLPRKVGNIHLANSHAPLLIDGCELDYFIFFMHLVGGSAGMFRVLQRDTITLVRSVLAGLDDDMAEVSGKLAPPKPLGITPTGAISFEASLLYSGALFTALLEVEPNGNVEMPDDDPLCGPIDALKEPQAMED